LKGQPGKVGVPGVVTAFVALFCILLLANRFLSLGESLATGVMLLVAVLAGIGFVWIES